MSTTTQILFNSPALHSLKRDQLVKLCKIHTLKASGKNKDLIQRLRLHAKSLPLDDPLSVAARSDNPDAKVATDSEGEASTHSQDDHTSVSNNNTRPSEQWEVVMDTIAEVDEDTLRSNRGGSGGQIGEFGTHTSKASVTSSLKAIASSLGLKRNLSKTSGTTSSSSSSSSLSSKDVVASSSTLPTSDANGVEQEPPVEPIPGQSNLRGLPAPSEARLSLSQAPATTTIRLVSNPATNPDLLLSPPKLQPFATSFDLVPGTPGGASTSAVSVWPLSPGGATRESLYPPIPSFEGFGDLLHKQQSPRPRPSQYDISDMDIDLDIPGGLLVPSIREPTPEKVNTSPRLNTGATPKSTEKPSAEPVDIFSPAPKVQNASARSKLAIPRSQPFVFGSPLPQHNMSNRQFRTAAQSVLDEMNKRLAEEGVETVDPDVLNKRCSTEDLVEKQESKGSLRVGNMFDEIHQKEFDKMDSIASHYAAKRGAQSSASQPILSKKRKSSLVVKERASGVPTARHRPNGSRVASGASVKTLPGGFREADEDDEVVDRRMSKRPRVEREESDAPAQPDKTAAPPPPNPEEEAQKQKEREAIRRRLEHNKAKRRSSMGRPSLGRAPPPKAKPARVGFFASAKSLVQNVWNRGAGSKAPSNVPVSKPAQPKEDTRAYPKAVEAKKTTAIPGSSGAPPSSGPTKRIPSGGSSTSVQSNATERSALAPPVISGEGGGTATSRIWKSPTPSFNTPNSTAPAKSLTVAGHIQSNNRGNSLVGFSSLGSRTGLAADNTRASSMGAKSNIRNSAANLQKHVSGIPRSRTTSRLLAPTASSLAKMISPSRVPSTASRNENSTFNKASMNSKQRLAMSPQPGATLEQVTNSPPAKIFGQPLSPSPTRPPMSLTTAATTIVGQPTQEKQASSSRLPVPQQVKVLPGRRPRISRSKVIAKLASQRAVEAGANTVTGRTGGKVRSSVGAEVSGKTRQSYAGARGGDLLMSAKKRIRQSEHSRRSRAIAEGRRMDVD